MNDQNPEMTKRYKGSIFITVVICVVLVVLASLVGYNLGQTNPFEPEPEGDPLILEATDLGKNFNLDDLRTETIVNLENGYARIRMYPNSNFVMPQGSTLEAFLVDGGTVGEFGESSEVALDEFSEPSLSSVAVDELYDQAPYALSLGRVRKVETDEAEYYEIEYNAQNTLVPYDQLVVTLESDIVRQDYDPRPGGVVFQAKVADNLKTKQSLDEAKETSKGTKE